MAAQARDDQDRAILRLLQRDAARSRREIAEEVTCPRPPFSAGSRGSKGTASSET